MTLTTSKLPVRVKLRNGFTATIDGCDSTMYSGTIDQVKTREGKATRSSWRFFTLESTQDGAYDVVEEIGETNDAAV